MSDSSHTPRFDGLYRGPIEKITPTVSCAEYGPSCTEDLRGQLGRFAR